jgi:outer membrane autotransporter protein
MRALLRSRVLLLASCAVLSGSMPARAQSAIWDATVSNTHWYVPVPQLLAYASPAASFANPIPIGDQTLWSLGPATNGSFTGTSSAQLKLGPALVVENSTVQGFVATSGQITMVFTPTAGGTPTVGLGQMRSIDGVTRMEMQMITGDSLLVTHWAYMTPYDPATFAPPASQPVPANSVPQWAWMNGTPWRIVSRAIFGTGAPGRFVITNYQNGYFWGNGIGPLGSSAFTLLGSITPEGKVLFNAISRGNLTNLYGNATGNASGSQMLTSTYDLTGNATGGFATMSLVQPYAGTLAAQNTRYAVGAAEALYRVAASPESLTGPLAPVFFALDNLSGPELSKAISQTTPVLAGAASQATYNVQRPLQQAVTGRLDDLRAATPEAEPNIWLKPLGGVARQNGLDGVPGYRAIGGGLVAGIDQTVAPDLALGGLLAYAHHAFSGSDDAVPNTFRVSSYQLGLYGAYALRPDVEVNAQFDTGLNRNSESRSIAFMNSTASADYNSYTTHAGLGVRTLIPIQPGMALVPSLRVDFAQVRADSYGESGAGPLSLNVDGQIYRELMVTAGLKGAYRVAERVQFTTDAGIGYNTLNSQVQITAAYAGGGDSFATYGLVVSPWLYSAGVGLVGAKDNLDLGLRYGLQASPTGFLNQTGSLVLKIRI